MKRMGPHNPNGRMPGQLPTESAATVKDQTSIKKAAKEKVAALVDTEVIVDSKKHGTMKWKVVDCHTPPDAKLISKASATFPLKNFLLSNRRKSEVLVDIFLQISFLGWKRKLKR